MISDTAIRGSAPAPAQAVNFLLEALVREQPRLRDSGVEVDRPVGHVFCSHGEKVTDVYFPVSGVLSLVLPKTAGGDPGVDAGTVGCEGLAGLPLFLGLESSPHRVVQQLQGRILRVPAAEFCAHIDSSPGAARVLKRFTAFSLQLAEQNAVCNLFHDARQRFCRWLLTAADRTHDAPVCSSQAMLAARLGVRRQTIGELVLSLQRAGLISYRRTLVWIVDRGGVEAEACACYAAMRSRYGNVVGLGSSHPVAAV